MARQICNDTKSALTLAAFALLSMLSCSRPAAPKAEAGPVTVHFETDPPGAAIEVDGKPTEHKTPADLPFPDTTSHDVRFTLEGHEPSATNFVAIQGAYPVKAQLSVLLAVTVETTPPGAEVKRGKAVVVAATPGAFSVTPGEYSVRIEKEGFMPVDVTQRFSASERALALILTPAAYVELSSTPAGGVVVVDGEDTEHRTPARVPVVAGKPHVVVVQNGVNASKPRKVAKLAAGKTVKLAVKVIDAEEADAAAEQRRAARAVKNLQLEKKNVERQMAKAYGRDGAKHLELEQRLQEISEELQLLQDGEL